MGGDVFPPCCLTWYQTLVEVMKIMVPSFKGPVQALLHSVPPTLQHATANSLLCKRRLDLHGQVWVSLLWGHISFLLGPSAQKVLFVPSKSLFSQSCVSSGGSMMGLMMTSSKRSYALPKSAAHRAPAPVAGYSRRHSHTQSLWVLLVCTRFCLSSLSTLVGMGFDYKSI